MIGQKVMVKIDRSMGSYHPKHKDIYYSTADFLCKLLIEANVGKVERAIEEAASRCAEGSEYIAEPRKTETVEEPMSIRLRRAR